MLSSLLLLCTALISSHLFSEVLHTTSSSPLPLILFATPSNSLFTTPSSTFFTTPSSTLFTTYLQDGKTALDVADNDALRVLLQNAKVNSAVAIALRVSSVRTFERTQPV